jgi:hypothetical protein
MPISYALLLCVPIGFLCFFIGRLTSRFVVGRYDQFERRASIAFGIFGALIIPDIWTLGCLQDEFPSMPGPAAGCLLFSVEGLILAAVFQLFRKSNVNEAESKEKVEP